MNKDKNYWHSRMRAQLGRVAKRLGISSTKRVIRSNKAGPAIGGEVTMSAPEFGVYVHISCPRNGYGQTCWTGCNYIRRATEADPYGVGMDKPNHTLLTTTDDAIVAMIQKVTGRAQ